MTEPEDRDPLRATGAPRWTPAAIALEPGQRDELAGIAARAWDECYSEPLEWDPVRQGWRAVARALHAAATAPVQQRLNAAEARLVLAIRLLGAQANRAEVAERWVREQGPCVLSLLDGEPQHSEGTRALDIAMRELRAIVRPGAAPWGP